MEAGDFSSSTTKALLPEAEIWLAALIWALLATLGKPVSTDCTEACAGTLLSVCGCNSKSVGAEGLNSSTDFGFAGGGSGARSGVTAGMAADLSVPLLPSIRFPQDSQKREYGLASAPQN
ncbi:MAG TPA: hypothetical protein VGB07_26185 [Blastocatellia bacterium]